MDITKGLIKDKKEKLEKRIEDIKRSILINLQENEILMKEKEKLLEEYRNI